MPGFWEPHTSSHDFCEENYTSTQYIAELLNCLTSFPITISGAWGWAMTPPRYRTTPRFALSWLAFIVVGLGSAAFHATLKRWAQALDEVPMVLGNLLFVFCLARPSAAAAPALATGLGAVAVALTIIYTVFEAYIVFLSIYGIVVIYLAAESWRLIYRSPAHVPGNLEVLKYLWRIAFVLYGFGFSCWCADHIICATMNLGWLHIAWHGLACAGTFTFLLILIALAADADKHPIQVRWARCVGLPVLPILVLPNDEVEANKKCS